MAMNAAHAFPLRSVLLVVLVGLAVRVAWAIVGPTGLHFPDENRFWCEALSVAGGGPVGCRGVLAHDMPLPGLFAGAVIAVAGPDVRYVQALWVMISAITAYPVAYLGWRLCGHRAGAVVAALGFSLYPFSVFYAPRILSETLFLFFVASGVSVLVWLLWARLPRRSVGLLIAGTGFGLAVALAHLTRPTLLHALPFVFLWIAWFAGGRVAGEGVRRSVLAMVSVVAFCLVCSPWIARNYVAFDAFVPGTLGAGQALLEGNNPLNDTGGVLAPSAGYLKSMPTGLDELARDRWKKARAMSNIRSDLDRFQRLAWLKTKRFWNIVPNATDYQSSLYKIISALSLGPIIILAALYPFLAPNRWRLWVPLAGLFVFYTLLHAITIGSIRYRLPLEPLMIALSAASIAILWHRYLAGSYDRLRGRPSG